MKLVVTIPAYNEEESIANVIAEIPRDIEGIEKVEILIIDDGSTDDTVKKAEAAGADKVLSHKKNEGLGIAFKDGLETALEMGADLIVNLDGDGQYNALEIPNLIKPLLENKAEIALGWRDIDCLDFMPRGKKMGNKIATWITSTISGLPIKDAQSGFRAFSKEAALRMNTSGRYTYVQETIMEAKYKGLKIEQIPIEFRPRQGKSRLIPSLTSYARRAGAIILGTYWRYHAMKILSLTGGVLIIAGLALGGIVLAYYIQNGTISSQTSYIITAPILIVTGLNAIISSFFANKIKKQRLFYEEILYRLKKKESNNSK